MSKSLTEIKHLSCLPVLELVKVHLVLESAVGTALIDIRKKDGVSLLLVAHALQQLGLCAVPVDPTEKKHIGSIAIGQDQMMTNYLSVACTTGQKLLKYSLMGVPRTMISAIIDREQKAIDWKVPERMKLNPLSGKKFPFSDDGMAHEVLLLDYWWNVARNADPLLRDRWYAEKSEDIKEYASIHHRY